MREIEFRGKAINDGVWVYGDLHLMSKTPHIHDTFARSVHIDTSTVGQYTGLRDKNGKKIYEGDILAGSNGSINGYEWPFRLEVKWDKDKCKFTVPTWGYIDSTHYYEVIGNIHDNRTNNGTIISGKVKQIYTQCHSFEDADAIGHFIMSKGYEGIQNDSYRYCKEAIKMALKENGRHNRDYCFIGVNGGNMVIGRSKKEMRRKLSFKYIEKERVFRELLEEIWKRH